jgi:hypothetical protein
VFFQTYTFVDQFRVCLVVNGSYNRVNDDRFGLKTEFVRGVKPICE